MAIGLTLVDVNTGTNMLHEFYSNLCDERFGLDELVRIMQIFRSTEIVIYYHPIEFNNDNIKKIKSYLELDKYKNYHFYVYHNKKGNDQLNLLSENTFKINYQNNYLSEIFDFANNQLMPNGKKSAIEILNLEKKSYATISLLIILKYIGEHNILLLKNLTYPEIYLYDKHLILGNNAIEQLNIIDSNSLQIYNNKFQSLFDVVNKTSTPMGKRFLKENLLNPISQENKKMIIKRYNIIDLLLKEKLFKKIQIELKNIYDVERLHRRMAMGIIAPYEFYRLDLFYQSTTKIISLIKNNDIFTDMLTKNTVKDFLTYQINYNKEYEFEELKNYSNFNEINKSFFKKGIHENIDKIQNKIDSVWTIIDSVMNYFMGLISSKCKKTKQDTLKIESNDKEGYFLTINKSNETILKTELKNGKEILKIYLSVGKNIEVKKDDITFKKLLKGRTKIFIAPLVEQTINLSEQKDKMTKLIKKKFTASMVQYYINNKILMHKISKFIAEIDFLVSGAAVADEYYYCKPSIPSTKNIPSYFRANSLRHAIIERLCDETEYVPNNIELGNVPLSTKSASDSDSFQKKNGVLLFGLNWAGKSSLMKSIGIAIILAQIGYYVPAQEFVYEPYMALYARITGNDNIFKGLSSFALEMTELDAILMRTETQGTSTLVIGDEVCRGTEDISGRAIVASALISLSECNSSFIFSSHLHDIQNIKEVKNLKNLRLFYLRAEYDEEKDCLIFNRKLIPGSGPSVYGLMVAKYLIKNIKFINKAEIIKNQLMNKDKINIPIKTSNYNKKLLVKYCNICRYYPKTDCHKELESHHINFQKNCLENGKIKEKQYLNKNKLYNLVVLCRKCHSKVHNGEIMIKGYSDTSIGPLLDYVVDTNKKILYNFNELMKLKK